MKSARLNNKHAVAEAPPKADKMQSRSEIRGSTCMARSLGRHVAVHIVEEKPDSLWRRGAPKEPHVKAGANRGGDEGERDRDHGEQHGVPPKLVSKA